MRIKITYTGTGNNQGAARALNAVLKNFGGHLESDGNPIMVEELFTTDDDGNFAIVCDDSVYSQTRRAVFMSCASQYRFTSVPTVESQPVHTESS